MSKSPFKNHKFLQSQALHNGLFQKLHSAYICMKKLQEKKQLSLFVFWSPNQKGDWIHFYHISEVTGEQLLFFSHVTDE